LRHGKKIMNNQPTVPFNTDTSAWSEEQFYRYWERIGMLCGAGDITIEAHEIAVREAEEYGRNH
jgi:hypothetical protein